MHFDGLTEWNVPSGDQSSDRIQFTLLQELHHKGAPPSCIARLIHRAGSALDRQTMEAMRIKRREGEGTILNSKYMCTTCYVSWLHLEEKDKLEQMGQRGSRREQEEIQLQWERRKTESKGAEVKRIAKK